MRTRYGLAGAGLVLLALLALPRGTAAQSSDATVYTTQLVAVAPNVWLDVQGNRLLITAAGCGLQDGDQVVVRLQAGADGAVSGQVARVPPAEQVYVGQGYVAIVRPEGTELRVISPDFGWRWLPTPGGGWLRYNELTGEQVPVVQPQPQYFTVENRIFMVPAQPLRYVPPDPQRLDQFLRLLRGVGALSQQPGDVSADMSASQVAVTCRVVSATAR